MSTQTFIFFSYLLKAQLILRKCQLLKNISSFYDDANDDFITRNEKRKKRNETIISLTKFIVFILWIFDATTTFFLIAFVTSRFFVVHFFKWAWNVLLNENSFLHFRQIIFFCKMFVSTWHIVTKFIVNFCFLFLFLTNAWKKTFFSTWYLYFESFESKW